MLADTIKRIGLAERTGRGIDHIYEGMLRYGRPAPDYSVSNEFTVAVQMVKTAADLDFHGTGRGRTYTLSAALYRRPARIGIHPPAGFAFIQQEQMVLSYIDKHGSIKRADVMELCHLDRNQAYHRESVGNLFIYSCRAHSRCYNLLVMR